jgi:uncharacterized protein YggE
MNMRRLTRLAVLVTAAILGSSGVASAQVPGPDTVHSQVRTVATAVRHVAPNLAIVKLNFIAEGRSPREAGRRLAARADSLRRALINIGIPRDSLATASDWYWWGGRVEVVVSNGRFVQLPRPDSLGRLSYNLQDTLFRARDAIEVRVAQLSKIGAVIDTAMAHGISDISSVQFQNNDLSTARDQALREATEDAKRQAELIAASSGMRLGRVLAVSTYAEADRIYGGGAYGEAGAGLQSVVVRGMGGGGGTEVIPRSLPVSMTAYGRWELLPKP